MQRDSQKERGEKEQKRENMQNHHDYVYHLNLQLNLYLYKIAEFAWQTPIQPT